MGTNTNLLRRHRRLLGVAALVIAAAALGTACEPQGCAGDCITSVTISPGTTRWVVKTNVKTKASIYVYATSAMTSAIRGMGDAALGTEHAYSTAALTPETKYWYRVNATDEAGKVRSETGSFVAKKRAVSVKVTRINLIDDSDPIGTGELSFDLKVHQSAFFDVYSNGDMGSGADVKNLSIVRNVAPSVPGTVSIAFRGVDDDCGPLFCYVPPLQWNSGSATDGEWGTATTTVTAPSDNGTENWTAKITGTPVAFQVWGTATFTYS